MDGDVGGRDAEDGWSVAASCGDGEAGGEESEKGACSQLHSLSEAMAADGGCVRERPTSRAVFPGRRPLIPFPPLPSLLAETIQMMRILFPRAGLYVQGTAVAASERCRLWPSSSAPSRWPP